VREKTASAASPRNVKGASESGVGMSQVKKLHDAAPRGLSRPSENLEIRLFDILTAFMGDARH
jgi:hypothetical protein